MLDRGILGLLNTGQMAREVSGQKREVALGMKCLQVIAGLVLGFGSAAGVYADGSNDVWAVPGQPNWIVAEKLYLPLGQDGMPRQPVALGVALSDATPLVPLPTPSAEAESSLSVRELPEAPNSAALFLCALGSLGAWHLTRSARKLHFGSIPEWYHTGGPVQIGHAVPVDLSQWGFSCHDRPDHDPQPCADVFPTRAPTYSSQVPLIPAAPRGPPLLLLAPD